MNLPGMHFCLIPLNIKYAMSFIYCTVVAYNFILFCCKIYKRTRTAVSRLSSQKGCVSERILPRTTNTSHVARCRTEVNMEVLCFLFQLFIHLYTDLWTIICILCTFSSKNKIKYGGHWSWHQRFKSQYIWYYYYNSANTRVCFSPNIRMFIYLCCILRLQPD